MIAYMKNTELFQKRLNLIYHIYISTCANGKWASAIETGHYTTADQTTSKLIPVHLTASWSRLSAWNTQQFPVISTASSILFSVADQHFFSLSNIIWRIFLLCTLILISSKRSTHRANMRYLNGKKKSFGRCFFK